VPAQRRGAGARGRQDAAASAERAALVALFARHLSVAAVGLSVAYLFWLTRAHWDSEMRLWKAVGDASLVLLYATLASGALARLRLPGGRLVRYRRELGIWFALFGIVHAWLILDGWAGWDLSRFLGYEFVPELGRLVRLEPGFGLANLIGVTAGAIALLLLATSSDRAIRRLGAGTWKFLHQGAYVVLWLTVLHVAYFLFVHYTEHFHRAPPAPDWFRFPFVALTAGLVGLQAWAFLGTARRPVRHHAGP
jgi:methionine sulfoxide reductase heme-binding subunit